MLVAAASHSVSVFEYDDLMTGLLRVHADDVLDEQISGDKKAKGGSVGLIGEFARHHTSPIDAVPDVTLVAWCDRDPAARYPFAAAIATLYNRKNDENPDGWRDIARTLLLKTPDMPALAAPLARDKDALQEEVDAWRSRETRQDRARSGRFE